MPATAGRVRMPHNNVMTTSTTLKSSAVWQNVIGYDPYAPSGGGSAGAGPSAAGGVPTDGSAYQNMKGLMELAKTTTGGGEEAKGQWRGKGKLRGGWLDGTQVPIADDQGDDSSSSSSDTSSSDSAAPAPLAAPGGSGAKRARDDDDDDERRRKSKKSSGRKKESKSAKKKHKKSKHKKEKKHKSHKEKKSSK